MNNSISLYTLMSLFIRSSIHFFAPSRLVSTSINPSLPLRLISWSGFTTNFYKKKSLYIYINFYCFNMTTSAYLNSYIHRLLSQLQYYVSDNAYLCLKPWVLQRQRLPIRILSYNSNSRLNKLIRINRTVQKPFCCCFVNCFSWHYE